MAAELGARGMHSRNRLVRRGAVRSQQADGKDAGGWESLPPGFMHNEWEITGLLTAEMLDVKQVSLGGVEESFPWRERFPSPAPTAAGIPSGTGAQRLRGGGGGEAPMPLGRQQPPALAWPGRAPLGLVAPCCLPSAATEAPGSPWSPGPVPVAGEHP